MIFGVKNVQTELGEFSSEKCVACKDSYTYRFIKATRFLVVFFINLIPLSSRYEAVCAECKDTLAVDNKTGRKIAKANFNKRRLRLAVFTILKPAVAAIVIAAAVALPLTLRGLDTSPEAIKSLFADSEDGIYGVEDSGGNMIAFVQVENGVNTITFYDDVSVLVGEPGADGSFKLHEYRQEATNDAEQPDGLFLVRIPDNPGMLVDRFGIPVRTYYYDSANDTYGYSRGVVDLSSISYTADKVTYPFHYFTSSSDEPTEYVYVLYFSGGRELLAQFIPKLPTGETNQFVSLTVTDIVNGRDQTVTQYDFDDNMKKMAVQAGITQESSVQDILDFLEQYSPAPSYVTAYTYYKNTKVPSGISYSMPDANGDMQTVTQALTVQEKNGYYIVRAENQSE